MPSASEIAGRLGKPATSLSRPIQRLVDLGLARRDVPFGSSVRDTKRTTYHVADPFLRFWFRFVEPNRSRLEAGHLDVVAADVRRDLRSHVAGVWEELARASVPRLQVAGRRWWAASRWWGPGRDRRPLEVDLVAESDDGTAVLLGEAKWSDRVDGRRLAADLREKADRFPLAGDRTIVTALWVPHRPSSRLPAAAVTARDVVRSLR